MDNSVRNDELVVNLNAINIRNNAIPGTDHNMIKNIEKRKNRYLEIAFMACVSGGSLLFGFSSALATAKKKDTDAFDKGISIVKRVSNESGGSLAMRALLWGSIYACTGFGLFCFTVWKAMGVNDLKEFRQKAGNLLPRLTPKETPNTRTEFSSIKDFLEYIIEESDKTKKRSDKND